MKKLSLKRKSFEFEYEFSDGAVAVFTYKEPTTQLIDEGLDIDSTKESLQYAKRSLEQCLSAKNTDDVAKLMQEQQEQGNIYGFKKLLDEELGKLM